MKLANKRVITTMAAVACLAVVAACGSDDSSEGSTGDTGSTDPDSPQGVYEKYAAMDEPARTEALVAAAQEEGKLVIYGRSTAEALGAAFGEKYGIDVEVYDMDPQDQLIRIVEEAEAGRDTFDVMTNSDVALTYFADETGLLAPYESPLRDQLPEAAQGEFWTGNQTLGLIVAYNTDEVDEAELPDDYFGFADPEWKGRIALDLDSFEWYAALTAYYLDQGMSQEEIDEAFHALAANAKVTKGQSYLVTLVGAGQTEVCLQCYFYHVEDAVADGAPVAYKPVAPTFVRYDADALSAKAPHPAAALLYMDWLLAQDGGVATTLDEGRMPTIDTDYNPLEGATETYLDIPAYNDSIEDWTDSYRKLLRGADELPPDPEG